MSYRRTCGHRPSAPREGSRSEARTPARRARGRDRDRRPERRGGARAGRLRRVAPGTGGRTSSPSAGAAPVPSGAMNGPMRVRTAAKAIVVRDDHLLAIKCQGRAGLFYILPGGGQEPGEDLVVCLQRECLEEIGVGVEVGPLRYVRE